MTDEVMDAFVRQTIEAQRVPFVTLAWQGGEPTLMGLDFFRRAARGRARGAARGLAGRAHDPDQRHAARRRVGRLPRRERRPRGPEHRRAARAARRLPPRRRGPPGLRPGRGGCASAPEARRRVQRALHRQRGQRARTRSTSTATSETSSARATCSSSRSSRSRRRPPRAPPEPSPTAACRSLAYGEFLSAIFDEWVRHDVGEMFVQFFDGVLAAYVRGYSSLCVLRPTCGEGVALEHNGDVYSCDHFVDPPYLLGNIMETPIGELVRSREAAGVRRGEARHAAALLPRVRVPLRVQRRVPQEPHPAHPRRRAGAQLAVRGTQATSSRTPTGA